MFWMVAGMGLMARTACPAFIMFVNMHKMKIEVTVPEVRQLGSPGDHYNGLLMAAEAEAVILFTERFVKCRRIRAPQYPEIFRPVRVMTA